MRCAACGHKLDDRDRAARPCPRCGGHVPGASVAAPPGEGITTDLPMPRPVPVPRTESTTAPLRSLARHGRDGADWSAVVAGLRWVRLAITMLAVCIPL